MGEFVDGPWLDTFMTWLSAKETFGLPLLALLALGLIRREGRRGVRLALCLLLTVGLADAGGNALKGIFQQPRPCAERPAAELRIPPCPGDRTGMPSNHALNFFAALGFIALVLRDWRWSVPLALVAVGVAVSRVYLDAHTPAQVLVGATLGLVFGLIMAALCTRRRPPVLPSSPQDPQARP